MTDRLLKEFKQEIDALELLPSDGGRFEVSVDGELVHSKLASGAFPPEDTIVKEVRARL